MELSFELLLHVVSELVTEFLSELSSDPLSHLSDFLVHWLHALLHLFLQVEKPWVSLLDWWFLINVRVDFDVFAFKNNVSTSQDQVAITLDEVVISFNLVFVAIDIVFLANQIVIISIDMVVFPLDAVVFSVVDEVAWSLDVIVSTSSQTQETNKESDFHVDWVSKDVINIIKRFPFSMIYMGEMRKEYLLRKLKNLKL